MGLTRVFSLLLVCFQLSEAYTITAYKPGNNGVFKEVPSCVDGTVFGFVFGRATKVLSFIPKYSLSSCLDWCEATASCTGVAFELATGLCFQLPLYSLNVDFDDPCCLVLPKICPYSALDTTPPPTTTPAPTTTASTTTTTPTPTSSTSSTTTSTTTTTPPSTTEPIYPVINTLIGESGKCPDPYLKAEDSLQVGGTLLLSNATSEECKQACLQDPLCGAADYDKGTLGCFKHGSHYPPSFKDGTEPCCDHYVKTDCVYYCYKHSSTVSLLDTEPLAVSIPSPLTDLVLQQCASQLCVTIITTNIASFEYTVERSCASSQGVAYPDTSCTGSNPLNCVCRGSRCNSLAGLPVAYYPLDCSLEDYSGYLRHAVNPQQSLVFDGLNAMKNYSAAFNGNNCISVTGTANIMFGSSVAAIKGSFTVAFWVRRLGISESMAIINNGPSASASFEVTSHPFDFFSHLLTADFHLNGLDISISGLASNFAWQFVAFVVERVANSDDVTVRMYLADITDASLPVLQMDSSGPHAAAGKGLRSSSFPVKMGYQEATNHWLTGNLDEVYLYNIALPISHLQSIVDQTKPFP